MLVECCLLVRGAAAPEGASDIFLDVAAWYVKGMSSRPQNLSIRLASSQIWLYHTYKGKLPGRITGSSLKTLLRKITTLQLLLTGTR